MPNNLVTYYIGFYRFTDTKIWQRSSLEHSKDKLKAYLERPGEYIDKSSIHIIEVQLPE